MSALKGVSQNLVNSSNGLDAMVYDPDRHHRRSIRYAGYDYASPGFYFVTLCTQDRLCLFGEIRDGRMVPNAAGNEIVYWWSEIATHFSHAVLDEFALMPNHLHGIVQLTPPVDEEGGHIGPPLPRMVQWFKTMSTAAYLRGVKQDGWPSFSQRLWQRNYYERIIRSDKELDAVRFYITENPRNWLEDTDYVS